MWLSRAARRGPIPLRAASPLFPRWLRLHLGSSALVVGGVGLLLRWELSAPCPPGGPLGGLGCGQARDLALGSLGLGAVLYVAALTATLIWAARLRRGGGDPRAVRDWYLLVAVIGLPLAPMLAFTLLSALR